MKRIFISTNYYQLYNVIRVQRDNEEIREIKEKTFISVQNGSILLLKDSEIDLPHNIQINKDTDFLLWHTTTLTKGLQIINKFSASIRGEHNTIAAKLYKPVFDIILGTSKTKAEDIIKFLFANQKKDTLNRLKTDFLYSIYNGKKPNEIEIFDSVKQATDAGNLSETFNEKTYNRQLDHQDTTILEAEEQGAFQIFAL